MGKLKNQESDSTCYRSGSYHPIPTFSTLFLNTFIFDIKRYNAEKKIKYFIIICALCLPINIFAVTADEIIKEVDKLMNPNAKIKGSVIFKDSSTGSSEIYRMIGYTKDNNQKIIVTLELSE